jgi:hypothetical protein
MTNRGVPVLSTKETSTVAVVPAVFVVLAPEGGSEVGVGLLEVTRPYGLVVAPDGDRDLLARGLAGRAVLAAGHAGFLSPASVGRGGPTLVVR